MSDLKPGDVAILLPHSQTIPELRQYQGQDVVLIAQDFTKGGYFGTPWQVRAADGMEFWASDTVLQKRRPPPQREELGSWELCPWQPKQVAVNES